MRFDDYEILERLMNEIGIEETFSVLELDDGEEVRIKLKNGRGFYAKGRAKLFIAYLPPESW